MDTRSVGDKLPKESLAYAIMFVCPGGGGGGVSEALMD